MANKGHLRILKGGVSAWNTWRQINSDIRIDLSYANFTGADLSGAHLQRVHLEDADLRGAHLTGADLRGAHLQRAHLEEADLSGAHLTGADLEEAHLRGADFKWAHLKGTDLRRTKIKETEFNKADLREVDLSEAHLSSQNLSQLNISKAILKSVNLCQANLIGTNLDGATLTDAWLWETQRAGWSIRGIICETAYWDQSRQERTFYNPDEFERLYADKTKIVLYYEGGISPIEIATLPALIKRIEATHPGCVLRLQSVQEAPNGATVTLVVENDDGCSPDELRTLKTDIEIVSHRAIRAQRALLEERGIREQLESELQIVYNKIVPQIMRQVMEQSPGIQISGGTIYGNIVAEVSGANAEVKYTYNDLATIEALIREMLTHRAELPLTSAERTQFEEKLNAMQEQLAAQAPNHSLLQEALYTVRHILEAGVAHVLVGQWLLLLHKMR
jgi:uncharacterized protein YjbI with pentapeptide repeats